MSPKHLRQTSQNTINLSRPASPSAPTPEDPKRVDVIAYDNLSVSDEENIDPHATTAVNKAIKQAEYGAMGEITTYGNSKGLNLLESLHDNLVRTKRVESEISQLKLRDDSQQAQINSQQAQLDSQQAQINTLKEASQGFRHIRNRFLETYKRDWYNTPGQQSHVLIRQGNTSAHDGNAAVDSLLYTDPLSPAGRSDERVYISLYGLSPNQVKRLVAVGHRRSFDILDQRATWVANGQAISPDIAKAFDQFLGWLETNMEEDPSDPSTELGKRYNYFKWVVGKC